MSSLVELLVLHVPGASPSSSLSMKDNRAVMMLRAVKAGFHFSGWCSDIVRQMLAIGSKHPDSVIILMAGGAHG